MLHPKVAGACHLYSPGKQRFWKAAARSVEEVTVAGGELAIRQRPSGQALEQIRYGTVNMVTTIGSDHAAGL